MNKMDTAYLSIVDYYEKCFEKYGDTNKGVDWPNEEDTLTRYQVMLELLKYDNREKDRRPKLLDFGCGLGHMYDYICAHNLDIEYTGLDISPVFIKKCMEKYPNVSFVQKNILEDPFTQTYDYIILNGVFTEKRELSYEEMKAYFEKMIIKLYSNISLGGGIAFNVMSKDVDWERDDLFHLPLNELSRFLTKEVTRDFIVRYDYGLYEYTTYLYRR